VEIAFYGLSHFWSKIGGHAQENGSTKMVFPEIDFEDIVFIPNLKRIPLEVWDNTTACIADAYA